MSNMVDVDSKDYMGAVIPKSTKQEKDSKRLHKIREASKQEVDKIRSDLEQEGYMVIRRYLITNSQGEVKVCWNEYPTLNEKKRILEKILKRSLEQGVTP